MSNANTLITRGILKFQTSCVQNTVKLDTRRLGSKDNVISICIMSANNYSWHPHGTPSDTQEIHL